jgi:hypothetical protein
MLFKKSRAVKAATQAVQPFIKTLEMTGGLPPGFWEDPYVLGYLSGCIGIFAKLSTNGKIAGGDLGLVMINVLNEVSNSRGMEIAQRVIEFQHRNNSDFAKGVANADKAVSVAYGLRDYDADPDVIAARSTAAATDSFMTSMAPSSTEASKVSGVLQMTLFYDVVRARLGAET